MGFGDKLKGLKDQAQRRWRRTRTRSRALYRSSAMRPTPRPREVRDKIMKVGEKVEAHVDKFADGGADAPAAAAPSRGRFCRRSPRSRDASAAAAPVAGASAAAAPVADAPDPAFGIEGDAPQEECADAPIAEEPASPVTPSPPTRHRLASRSSSDQGRADAC